MSSFFCLAQCFWNLPILLHLSVAYPFSLLSTVLWCESNTICSFIHQLIDALVASIWGCYEKTCYNNICGYRNFVYTYVFISLAKIYRRWVVGLGSRYVFSIIRNSIFFLIGYIFLHPYCQCVMVTVFPHLWQHSVIPRLLISAILISAVVSLWF